MRNDQDNFPSENHPDAESALEARIVAWVAGEASAFEAAELERLIAEKPELAIFKRRIEAVHQLVADAARPDQEPLRLSEERRAKVLSAIGANDAASSDPKRQPGNVATFSPRTKAAWWSWRSPQIYFALSGMAAAGIIAVFVLSTTVDRHFAADADKSMALHRESSGTKGQPELHAGATGERVIMPLMLPAAPATEDAPASPAVSEMKAFSDARTLAPQREAVTSAISTGGTLLREDNKDQIATTDGIALSTLKESDRLVFTGSTAAGSGGQPATQKDPRSVDAVADPIVKLDAFTVSESREGNATALAMSAAPPLPAPSFSLSGEAAGKPASILTDSSAAAGGAKFGSVIGGTTVPSRFGSAIITESGGMGGVASAEAAKNEGDLKANLVPLPTPSAQTKTEGISAVSAGSDDSARRSFAPADEGKRSFFEGNAVAGAASFVPPKSVASARGAIGGAGGAALGANAPSTSPSPAIALDSRAGAFDAEKQKAQAAGSGTFDASTVGGTLAQSATKTPAETEVIKLDMFQVSAPAKKASAKASRTAGVVGGRDTARQRPLPDNRTELDKTENTAPAGQPAATATREETSAAKDPVSTFSLHVSDVSFRLATAAVAAAGRGEEPPPPDIRAEEFYNAFDYGDPAPAVSDKIDARLEQSIHPVLQQRNLLRIAMKVPSTGRTDGQSLQLTILLDTSGSMEREDRRAAVRRALAELIALLRPNDHVTLIGFARQPRLLADNVPGNQAGYLVDLAARTPAEGGTNLESALKLASEQALRRRVEKAQNRIVVLTDGAANLGNADPARLAKAIETLRQRGIAFDACGIGLEGVGDEMLESLTRKGDGRYYVIERPEAADAGFARQLAGAFHPAAENVKLQVRFNPSRVGNYRLIGFDRHRLREEDFRNDRVDAAELAADEAANALYQIEVLPQGTGEIGEVFVRFRDPATGEMVERSWTIRYDPRAPRFDRASPSLQLAGVAALLAEGMNDGPLAGKFKLGDLAGVVNSLRGHYANNPRVQELVTMYSTLRRLNRE